MKTEPTRYPDPFRTELRRRQQSRLAGEARCIDCGSPGTTLCSPCEAVRAAADDTALEERWTPEEFEFEEIQ